MVLPLEWIITSLLLLTTRTAFASDCASTFFLSIEVRTKSACEVAHTMALGSGISSPSTNAMYGENPAGMAYNGLRKIQGSVYKPQGSTDPWRIGTFGLDGNGTSGGGIGMFHNIKTPESTEQATLVGYGAGTMVDSLGIAVGLSGLKSVGSSWAVENFAEELKDTLNFGFLTNPRNGSRFGFTTFNLLSSTTRGIGVGYAATLGKAGSFDIAYTGHPLRGFSGVLKPSFGIVSGIFQLAWGYGFPLAKGEGVWTKTGHTAMAAIRMGDTLRLQARYNYVELYNVAMTLTVER